MPCRYLAVSPLTTAEDGSFCLIIPRLVNNIESLIPAEVIHFTSITTHRVTSAVMSSPDVARKIAKRRLPTLDDMTGGDNLEGRYRERPLVSPRTESAVEVRCSEPCFVF